MLLFFQYYITSNTRAGIVSDRSSLYMVNSELQQMKKKIEMLETENSELHSRLKDKETIIALLGRK